MGYSTKEKLKFRLNKKRVAVASSAALLSAILVLRLFSNEEAREFLPDRIKTIIDVTGNKEKGALEVIKLEESKAKGLRCIISSAPYFSAADAMGSFSIMNHPDNEGYLLQVEITDSATGKLMYISPSLEPNEKIQEDYLSTKNFEPGIYSVTATFNFYNQADTTFYYAVPITKIQLKIGKGDV